MSPVLFRRRCVLVSWARSPGEAHDGDPAAPLAVTRAVEGAAVEGGCEVLILGTLSLPAESTYYLHVGDGVNRLNCLRVSLAQAKSQRRWGRDRTHQPETLAIRCYLIRRYLPRTHDQGTGLHWPRPIIALSLSLSLSPNPAPPLPFSSTLSLSLSPSLSVSLFPLLPSPYECIH